MTARARGDYFERQTREALREAGWIVIRSAGSYGPADLIAVRRNSMDRAHVLLISCKVDGRIGPAERAALLDACDQAAAEPLVASRPSKGSITLMSLHDHRQRAELRVPTKPRHRKDDADPEDAP
jgi:Holliday junction resolvase